MSETASYDAVIKAIRMLKKIRKLEGTILIHEGVLLSADTLYHESQNEGFVREVNALISLYRNTGSPLSRTLLGFDGVNVMIFNAAPFVLCLIFGELERAESVEKAGEGFLLQWADSLKIDPTRLTDHSDLDRDAITTPVRDVETEEAISVQEAETQPVTPMPELPGLASSEAEKEIEEQAEVSSESVEAESETEELTEPLPETPDMDASSEKLWNAYRSKVETLFSKVLGRAQATRLIERELAAMGIEEDGYLATSQFRPFGQKLIKKVKDRSLRKQLELELVAIVEDFIS